MAPCVKLEVDHSENVIKCTSVRLIDQIEAKDGIYISINLKGPKININIHTFGV
jgi:hypothetical protein